MSSNFPNGFANGVTIRGIPLLQVHPGRVWWVNNSTVLPEKGIGGSNSNDGTYLRPFSTVDYAIGRCTASRGDIIAVMPGHAETISTASGITSDVAGVAIVGLGAGALRPTFTFSATTSTWVVSAANCSFSNLIFRAGVAEVVTMHSLTGDADDTSFENCRWDQGSTFNWVDAVTLATGADRLSWENCVWIGSDANNDACITGVAHDGFRMKNCFLAANTAQTTATGLVDSTGNVTDIDISDCKFRSNVDGALFIDFNGATCSGVISNCYFSSIDTAGAVAAAVDATGAHAFECYVAGEADTYGIVGGGSGPYVDS